MKAKKWLVALLACACALCTVAALAACGGGGDTGDTGPNEEIVAPGPETGVYYFDAEDGEYFVALSDGNRFSFAAMGSVLSGKYTLEAETLTLTFGNTEEQAIVGTLNGETLSLTYRGTDLRFLKKVNRTVHFEVDGGSAVADVTVLNGKPLAKPADPTRDGYAFIGWYADAAHTAPYLFGTLPVTSDLTLYAQWGEKKPGQAEFTVDFDLGGAAGEYAEVSTVGGKLYTLPTPAWDGRVFDGWWVSMYDKADRLSYRCSTQTVFNEDTTLFAVWKSAEATGLASPDVTIGANTISWQGISGAVSYTVSVTGPEDFTAVNSTGSETTVNVNFAAAPAGDYVVSVTANGTGANASAPTVLYYKNKSLARVSHFNVMSDSLLVFDGVENAERYFITVECGTKGHHHENFDNDTSTNFNFANCALTDEGIKFTVTAVADGFASSVSREFVYNRVLGEVTGLHVDDGTQTAVWNAVAGASEYYVDVECANAAFSQEHVRVVGKTSFSLKTFPAGDITVKVVPVTKGYNSPEAASVAYHKTTIATPEDLHIDGMIVSWAPVAGAVSYVVRVNNIELPASGTECNISGAIGWKRGDDCTISVKAVDANGSSLYSDAVTARYNELYDVLTYSEGVLSWRPVVGAEIYEVAVESEDPIYVEDGSFSAEIAFPHAGVNTVRVRYVMHGQISDWVSLDINVYTIEFDTRMGNRLDPLYKAQGDKLELPDAVRDGYDFDGWYNAPGGAAGGGAPFTDDHFFGQDSVVYANWKAASYTVTFNYMKGSGETETQEVTFGGSFQFPEATIDDAKYAFAGWFSLAGGEGTRYTDDHGESVIAWNAPSDVTVYAFYAEVLTFTKVESANEAAYYSVTGGPQISQVTQVTVPVSYPDGEEMLPVKEVAPHAFASLQSLRVVNIPDTVQDLNHQDAFYYSRNLEAVNIIPIPSGERPEGCEEVKYASEDGVVIYTNEITAAQVELVFFPLGKTGEYKIPEGVEDLPLKIFNNAKISEVTIPNTVLMIETNAFLYCDRLVAVNFEEGGEKPLVINDRAFAYCTELQGIELPSRFALGEEATVPGIFDGCRKLAYLDVADGNTSFGSIDGVLTTPAKDTIIYVPKARAGSYTVPTGVREIEDEAFKKCTSLTEIVIPNFVTVIGKNAFEGCTGVRSIVFEGNAPANVSLMIEEYAFSGNTNVRTIVFEDGARVTSIGSHAFANNRIVTSISLPQYVSTIGDHAFADCVMLASVSFAENGVDLSFGENVFENCQALTSVHLPANVKEFSASVFAGCENLREVTVDDSSEYFQDVDGVLYNKAGTEILFYAKARTEETPQLLSTLEKIGEGVFSGNNHITSITIGANVKSIAASAFANCSRLRTITFEAGTEELTIGESAFENCPGLTTVNFPERLKSIPKHALYHDAAVTTVSLGGATVIGEGAFAGTGISTVDLTKVTQIDKEAFSGTGLTAIDLENVTQIGDSAFASTAIGAVTLASGVSVGTGVFKNCTNLTNVTVQSGVTEIPQGTFSGCTALKTIQIPASVTKIGKEAFANCSQLATVTIEDGEDPLNLEGGDATTGVFYLCVALETIALPARTQSVGAYAFKGCSQLATVTFAGENQMSDLETIGKEAFSGTILNAVTIPEKVTAISESAFANTMLETLTLPTKLESIGASAFAGVVTLNGTLQIPATVKTIGASAFAGAGFEEVTFTDAEEGTLELGDKVFQNAALSSIVLPKQLTKLGSGVFDGCTALASISVAEGNTAFSAKDGILYNQDKTQLIYCPIGKTGTVQVPNTVILIKNGAFVGSSLTSVTFEEGGEALTIGEGAQVFGYGEFDVPERMTMISSITLPARLTTIGNKAFQYSNGLTTIEIPKGVTSIGTSAFESCAGLTTFTFEAADEEIAKGQSGNLDIKDYALRYNEKIASITFPARTKSIGEGVLYCNMYDGETSDLAQVIFEEGTNGSHIETIGNNAFYGSKITEIVFPVGLKNIGEVSELWGGMTWLDGAVLGGCDLLTSVTLPNEFEHSEYLAEMLPQSVATINVPSTSQAYKVDGGVLFDFAMQTLMFYPFGKAERSYVVPDGVTTIGSVAFNKNEHLTQVTISKDVTKIEESAFEGCVSLGTVNFVEGSDMTIGDNAFKDCDALTTITLPARVTALGETMFEDCDNLVIVNIDLTTKISELPYGLFSDCEKLGSFTIPASVKTIGSSVFENCKQLAAISIPAEVASVGSGVFSGCAALSNVTFEGTKLTRLSSSMFSDCAALGTIAIPSSVTSIESSAFKNCTSLESVSFVGIQLTSIGSNVFENCTALENIELPTSVTSVDTAAFKNCTSLVSAKLLGVTSVSSSLFEGDTELADVQFSETLTQIKDKAFLNAASLEDFEFPSGLTSIGSEAFEASGLTFAAFPSTLASIGTKAFLGCSALVNVAIPFVGELDELKDETFADCTSLTELVIPSTILSLGTNVFRGVPALDVVPDNPSFMMSEGVIYNIDQTVLVSVPGSKTGRFEIPDTVTSIAAGAFAGSKVTEVKIPISIHEISEGAFEGCTSLTAVEMHDDIQIIGKNAFKGTGLRSVTIGQFTTKIGDYAFADCVDLTEVNFKPNGIEALSIGSYAFSGCTSLRSIEIPKRVRTFVEIDDSGYSPEAIEHIGIGSRAFSNDTMLETVTFEQTGAVFAGYKLTIGNYAFSGTGIVDITLPAWLSDYTYTGYDYRGRVQEVTIKAVGSEAFSKCLSLNSVTFNNEANNTITIGDATQDSDVFRESTIKTVNLSEQGSFVLGAHMFRDCKELGSFTIPENVIGVGSGIFDGCTSLETVEIKGTFGYLNSSGVMQVITSVFRNCTSLQSVTLPKGLEAIGSNAFAGCTALKTLKIPDTVKTIGMSAFEGAGLTELTLPTGLQKLDSYVFQNVTTLTELTIPESVSAVGGNCFNGWTQDQTLKLPFASEVGIPLSYSTWNTSWKNNCNAKLVFLKAAD